MKNEISTKEIIDVLEKENTMTLATSAGNRVTIRPMSHINEDLTVFFQTGADSLKVRQMRQNPSVALCVGTYEIEGEAELLGHPFDKSNPFFAAKYKEKHPGSYAAYSALDDEIVVKVNIKRVRQWRYIDGNPCLAEACFDRTDAILNDSRCGLHCTGCAWRLSHGCGGCVETNGHPFHGECPIAICCQENGHAHCGECEQIPCEKLYAYSYLDPEHGDKPQGQRVTTCRQWAVAEGNQIWAHVLLTSAGWFTDIDGGVKENIRQRFLDMLGKEAKNARVLFIPTAAIDDEAKRMAGKCFDELVDAGILAENIITHDIGGSLTADEAMGYDVIYFTGGDTGHLLRRIRETGFDAIIKKMVYANKVYVGASAGSLIATPNIGGPFDENTSGLALVNAYLSVHCANDSQRRTDLPLPHIPLTDNQALAVRWDGFELIED